MQEELVSQERDRAVLELAGAANHEINQPLTVILGRLEILLRRPAQEDPQLSELDTIYQQAQRIADIVRKIGKITRYETKHYVGRSNILDIDAAANESAEE
jgi:signal transduction histidine kinase